MRLHGDAQGVAPLGRLPVGNTLVEFNRADLVHAIRSAVGPGSPEPQKTLIEQLVVIAIIAIKTDGVPVAVIGTLPAGTLPQKITANLRVGPDGNLTDVDFGRGPHALQSLRNVDNGQLVGDLLGGPAGNSGRTTLNQGTLKALQDRASKMTPGLVEANSYLQGSTNSSGAAKAVAPNGSTLGTSQK